MSRKIMYLTRNLLTIKNYYGLTFSMPINKIIIRFEHAIAQGYDDNTNELFKTDKDEHKSYRNYLDEKITSSEIAIQALTKLPKLTRNAASKIVREWKIFETLSKTTILQNYEILHENGVQQSTLKDHPYALADTTSNIRKKILFCTEIELDITKAISLFQLKTSELNSFRQTHKQDKFLIVNYKNRIEYLADKLGYEINKLCPVLARYPYVLNISFHKIKAITEFMLDAGVKGEYIVSDLHIYKFSYSTIRSRIERAVKAEISPLKPWVIRCQVDLIENAEEKKNQRKVLLGNSNSIGLYISKLMSCDVDFAEALIKRGHNIDKISLSDLTKKLNFFRDKGYTIEDLYRAPNSLHSSYEKVVEKYNIWIDFGFRRPPLFVICTTHKTFEERLALAQQNKINNTT